MSLAALHGMREAHVRLNEDLHDPRGRVFISDWNGAHPYVDDYLGDLAATRVGELGDLATYSLFEGDEALARDIAGFHTQRDGVPVAAQQVVPGAGASSFLATIAFWLAERAWGEVLYAPPLYHTFPHLFSISGLEPRNVATGHAHEPHYRLDLPDHRAALIISDPVWYAGKRLRADQVALLADWQRATGSLVVVDGTFQYMPWDGDRGERTAALVPELTLRLVCPTKALSIHGFRFAYLLVPERHHEEISDVHGDVHGPSALANRVFAHRAMRVMSSSGSNDAMVAHARASLAELIDAGALTAHLEPECGYFVFARHRVPPDRTIAMGPRHFQLDGHPGYVRVNLINPAARALLLESVVGAAAAD